MIAAVAHSAQRKSTTIRRALFVDILDSLYVCMRQERLLVCVEVCNASGVASSTTIDWFKKSLKWRGVAVCCRAGAER